MEDATGTQGTSFYPQERFPSIIDTDDLVFELGKQVVSKVNKEKLLDSLIKKVQGLEQQMVVQQESFLASESTKVDLIDKTEAFKVSNELYVQNNEKLNAEITRLRDEIETLRAGYNKSIDALKSELSAKVTEFTNLKELTDAQIAKLEKEKEGLQLAVKNPLEGSVRPVKVIKKGVELGYGKHASGKTRC